MGGIILTLELIPLVHLYPCYCQEQTPSKGDITQEIQLTAQLHKKSRNLGLDHSNQHQINKPKRLNPIKRLYTALGAQQERSNVEIDNHISKIISHSNGVITAPEIKQIEARKKGKSQRENNSNKAGYEKRRGIENHRGLGVSRSPPQNASAGFA